MASAVRYSDTEPALQGETSHDTLVQFAYGMKQTFELEGSDKPAAVAESLFAYFD